jgi:NAD(P) transhydrogenase subunit beta
VLTFLKLQELMTGRPIVYRAQQAVFAGLVLVIVVAAALTGTGDNEVGLVLLALAALALGVALVLPVGGADVPVVISLLNSFTGLAVAASGFALKNTLLIVSGTLVGASGALLTRLMATAMGRSLQSIMFGALQGGSTAGSTAELGTDRSVRSGTPDDIGVMLAYSQRVTIVPGYGLAVAQAQHTIRELVDLLEQRGVEVAYAIHPVAGRMPGHMNVLLAEANVPYEQLKEMDEVNPEFVRTDVALVVGANDVVNPAARDEPGSPIYGMPILDVDQARHVVFMKRSMRPGFAGIDNKLLYDPKTVMLFGDAKESLGKLVAAVKAA